MDLKQAKHILSTLFNLISSPIPRLSLGERIDLYQSLWQIAGGEGTLPFENPKALQEELLDIQKSLKGYLDRIMTCFQGGPYECGDLSLFYKHSIGVRVNSETASLICWHGGDFKTAILAAFVEALASIPGALSLIGRCENCGGWFIRLSNRPKRFCSKHCAAVGMTKERRAREKEARLA